tara:strand:+ start:55 stop:1293 length:1239 start_codon:yes stop_codon:yes gene_type:complete
MSVVWILVILACIFAFYMAWTIGANDVANAMAPAVGSGVLTLRNAIIIAALAEFLGAVLVGSSVTSTIRKGIVSPSLFQNDPSIFMLGMTSALLGAALWLHAATLFGMPVSTTHSIVGAVIGFGLIAKGPSSLDYWTLSKIVMSWFVSPFFGGFLGFSVFYFIREKILNQENRDAATRFYAPYILFFTSVILLQSFVFKAMKNLNLPVNFFTILLSGCILGGVIAFVSRKFLARFEIEEDKSSLTDRFFIFLLILTSGYVAFAHGANDVANAVGPFSAVLDVFATGAVSLSKVPVPIWVLILGGIGIVSGLALSGWKVISTIGGKITEITPQNGFSAQLAAATTVLFCSQLGLPISTTHTVVGSVIGVGLARGVNALDLGVCGKIITSWFLTLPFAAGMTMLVYSIIQSLVF